MRVVVALGGNALLKRGQRLSAENQRVNVRAAAVSIAALMGAGHEVIISHGNGPQIGLLALQNLDETLASPYPIDVLSAETVGMIGYMIEQELSNQCGGDRTFATLLTQIEIDPQDPALKKPTKPIGPTYGEQQANTIGDAHNWTMGPDGNAFRRLVPSPTPVRIIEIGAIKLLADHGITVICAGAGGIPVARMSDGKYVGVEAVIDKDSASALLAASLDAEALLLLTDVEGVYKNWGKQDQQLLRSLTPQTIANEALPAGSMGPKVAAALAFARSGGIAGIGKLEDALAIIEGRAGTIVKH